MMSRRPLVIALGLLFPAAPWAGETPATPILLAQASTPDPVVVVEDRAARVRLDAVPADFTVTTPLGDILVPEGTPARIEQRFAPVVTPETPATVVRERADIRSFTLGTPLTLDADAVTRKGLTLPAGTIIPGDTTVLRLKDQVRRDAAGNILRDRNELRVLVNSDILAADGSVLVAAGTELRFRDRAPEIGANEVEIEDGVAQSGRNRGSGGSGVASARSDSSGSGSGGSARSGNSGSGGGGSARSGPSVERVASVDRGGSANSGSGRADRVERVDRSGRGGGDRIERPDRSGSGGGDRVERVDRSGSGGGSGRR